MNKNKIYELLQIDKQLDEEKKEERLQRNIELVYLGSCIGVGIALLGIICLFLFKMIIL